MPFDREAAPGAGAAENYYEVLGLHPGATDEEIEAAYADLAAMFAPAKVPAARQDYARRQRARLAAAYAVLADPDQRAAYDSRLGQPAPLAAPPAPSPAPPAPVVEAGVPLPSAPGAVEEPVTDLPAPVQKEAATMAAVGEPATADLPALAPPEPPPAPTLTIAPEPGAAPGDEVPAAADDELEAEPVEAEPATEQATARLPEFEAEESVPVADVDAEDEAEAAEISALAPDEDEEEDLAPWETLPAAKEAPPARPSPAPAARVTTAKPAPKARPAGAGTGAARTGGVALPNRREAAQIAARKPALPPAAPAPPARPGVPATRPASARAALARPATTRRIMTDDGEEELLAPRTRAARPAPPPPRKRKRSNTANKFAYQVMTVVIALVLIVGTVASFLSGTITPAVLDTPTPGAGAAAPLVSAGNSAAQAGNWAQALQSFQQALQVEPQNVQATLGLAEVYMSMTPPNPQQANAYAQQVIRIAPGSTEATTARNILAALSLTPQSTATAGSGSETTPAAAPTTAVTPAP